MNDTAPPELVNWNHVFIFSEIAACGSLKAASEKLGLSPSTLSEHLAMLESRLQTQLFVRGHRKLQLSQQGAILFRHAKSMFETGQRLINSISPVSIGDIPVNIGIVIGSTFNGAQIIIRDILKTFGPISMRIKHSDQDDMIADLLTAKIDIAFTNQRIDHKNISQKETAASEVGFYVSKEEEESNLKAALAKLPLLICKPEGNSPTAIEQKLIELSIHPVAVVTTEFQALLIDLCTHGFGVAAMSRVFGNSVPGVKELKLPPEHALTKERLFACWAKDAEKMNESIKRIIDLIQ